jgi:2-polyprenyl-3-methyl-5-hydroxy-6-metoxy-1,4-benzoquinol methylase
MKRGECIVCGSNKFDSLYRGILRCNTCGHSFAELDMSETEFQKIYNGGYFQGDEYLNYIDDKDVLQKNFRKRLKTLKKYLENGTYNSLLEIGCAHGFFLELAEKLIEDVTGIDVTKDGTEYAREILHLNAIHGDFLQHDFGDKKFDIVCMWDTIEHLRSPHLYIKKISDHMNPGGIIAITTGDIESSMSRIRKEKWRLIHPPTHVHYFSKKSITFLLQNYGFSVIHQSYCGFFRSSSNIAHNVLLFGPEKKFLYNLLKWISVKKFHIYLNLYDILFIIAKKDH